MAQVVYLFEF